MWKSMVLSGVALCLALSAVAADKEAKKVEVKGILRTGVVAIGAETTGTIVETKDGTFELEFGNEEKLRKQAAKLNGKLVVVKGNLEVRKGVEVKERKIITVSRLQAAQDQ